MQPGKTAIAASFGVAAKCLIERNVNQPLDEMSMIVVAKVVSSIIKARFP